MKLRNHQDYKKDRLSIKWLWMLPSGIHVEHIKGLHCFQFTMAFLTQKKFLDKSKNKVHSLYIDTIECKRKCELKDALSFKSM